MNGRLTALPKLEDPVSRAFCQIAEALARSLKAGLRNRLVACLQTDDLSGCRPFKPRGSCKR
jgi:hypothetical protein